MKTVDQLVQYKIENEQVIVGGSIIEESGGL